MKFKFTEEIPAIKEPSPKIDDALVNEEVLKLVRTLKLVQIGLNHEAEKIQGKDSIKIERLNHPPLALIKKRKWLIKFPKITTQANMGLVLNELKSSKLFLKRKKACEV